MNKYLKRSFISAGIELLVGMISIFITIFYADKLSEVSLSYLRSFGNALLVVGICILIRTIRLSKRKDLLEKMEIASNDERYISIRDKASANTLQISLIVEAFGGFLLAMLGYETIGLVLCSAYGIQTVIYFIAYFVNSKKF
ncbi:MAG: DUF2178 domain-containing protein [Clostridia bacterium]|nr:DUF2178 domain-containing protein [Clostridia bacterium]